jgi:hypothetical protein
VNATPIADKTEPVLHDPLVCGLDVFYGPPICPGCIELARWHKEKELERKEQAAEACREWGVRRPPRVLGGREQAGVLQRLLDLELTARRNPELGRRLRRVLQALLPEGAADA